jgi:hypothetical protein
LTLGSPLRRLFQACLLFEIGGDPGLETVIAEHGANAGRRSTATDHRVRVLLR